MSGIVVRQLIASERQWAEGFVSEVWGTTTVVAHETVYHPAQLPGFVAVLEGERVGLVTYQIESSSCEVVSLASTRPGSGIGTALLAQVEEIARREGCARVWLITTNDNLDALRFYQKRGFVLIAVHRGAVERARRLIKPEIPLIGSDGIPIRDEIELELPLIVNESSIRSRS